MKMRILVMWWVLSAMAVAWPAHAQSVYRCRDAKGALAFQDKPCAAGQAQKEVAIEPAPAYAASPDYSVGKPERASRVARVPARASARNAEPMSFECRAANGEVFYRHGRCPATIRGKGRGATSTAVTSSAIPRAEACARMAHTSHAGSERDETVSTYERNQGRDPCRRS